MSSTKKKVADAATLEPLPAPTPWPNANARLLGLGVGLPVEPLTRLAQFSPADFERLTLEWASDYLAKTPGIHEIQQRGGAGDKGRDVIVWLDPPGATPRRWRLYQCKHYGVALGAGKAVTEIGKVLHYTHIGDYSPPEEYWFVTHQGTTSPFQDLLDDPSKLRAYTIENWEKYCANEITSKSTVALTPKLRAHIKSFRFEIFRAKQPLELVNEHAKTRYHLAVFGLPLIDRPKPPEPPSAVAPGETRYVDQLYKVIGEELRKPVAQPADFAQADHLRVLFDRSRLTFYCAEGLKELARDQMANASFFATLLDEFCNGLFYHYNEPSASGYQRLMATIKAAQSFQLGGHMLAAHVRANDREGMCHQMANEGRAEWCKP